MSGDTGCSAPVKLKTVHVSFFSNIPAVFSMNTFDEFNRSFECLLPGLLIDRE